MTATAAPGDAPTAKSGGRAAAMLRFGAVKLDPHRNGLNLIRLVLAYSVLLAHGWYISGDGVGPHLAGENIGGWAVFGFFAISGYLITGSRFGKPIGEYLVHRVARIFPAFLVCLAVTAFAFAPIGYLRAHGTLDGFLTTGTTPLNYIISNAGLRMSAYDVAGTPTGVPYPAAWDGSLWSLYYEFLCYIVVAILAGFAIVKRSPWPLAAAWLASVLTHAGMGRLSPYAQGNIDVALLARLLPFFLAGGLLFQQRKRVVLTWPVALVALVVAVATTIALPWGAQLASPLYAYSILWLGAVLPCPALIRRNDISYGIYIYAFPVQQLLAIFGAHTWNLAVFDVVAAVATIPLAAASWLLLEQPIMNLARRAGPRPVGPRADEALPPPHGESSWDGGDTGTLPSGSVTTLVGPPNE